MTREWRKTGSETLLPGGTFHSRVQEGEPPERRSWMSHWIEETEVRFRGNKRGWNLWGRISNSWDVGRESSRSPHRGPLSQWLTVKPPVCEENSVRSSEASGSWKLNNPQWPQLGWEARLGWTWPQRYWRPRTPADTLEGPHLSSANLVYVKVLLS